MKTKCALCLRELERKPHRIKKFNYCNAIHQMKFEYENGIRDRKTIANQAHKFLKQKTLDKYKEGKPTKDLSKRGYIRIITPQGRKYEQHDVWEKHNGKRLTGHHIHHINGNKTDNRIENLKEITSEEHHKLHYREMGINLDGTFKGK